MSAGTIAWREYIAADRDIAMAFYRDLIGWDIAPVTMGTPNDPYQMVSINDLPITGFDTTDGSEDPPHWLTYLTVPDSVEATLSRAVDLGGEIVRAPQDLHGIGRYAVLRDPDRALVAAFQPLEPSTPPPATWSPAPGSISWYAVSSHDLGRTASFYAAIFGYDPPASEEVFSATNTPVLTTGQHLHAGVLPAGPDLAPQWLIYIVVPDADALLQPSIDLGGHPITPVMGIPKVGKILGIRDPLGAAFFVHQPE